MEPDKFAMEPERYELREAPAYHFSLDRREFFYATAAGVLISVTIPATAQRGAIEGRIRKEADGTVTVFTGKVEEGQGPRTEIAMAVAEEMRIPLDKVHVVMADTDLTPNDGITAGSRTTPGTIPSVREAAARLASPDKPTLTPPAEWKVLGKPQTRLNAGGVVTGEHKYPSDITRPEMLYGCILRPPAYGATLAALEPPKLPGVVVVRDGEFAGCAAPTSYEARKALQVLGAAAQWKTAEHPSSDVLFEYLRTHARDNPRGTTGAGVEEALVKSKRRLKATYTTAYVQHAPMEPRAAVAEWKDGRLTVWTGTSNPFSVRDQLAQTFRLKTDQVRVIVPDMGGGFGGKHTGEAAIEAARLAKEAGKPVKVRWTRAEEFMWAYFRPAALIDVEAGLDDAGNLTAWDFTNYNSGGAALDTPYRISPKQTRFVQCEAPLRQGSYRALASTANNFARESFMDEMAASAGKDPLAFRLAHLDNVRIRDVLTAAAQKFGWEERRKNRREGRGIGLSCGTEKNSVVAACAEVEVDRKTGMPRLVEICQAFECGPVLNPLGLRSQVEGCILMGLGAALREEIQFENGLLKNGRFGGYRVTRFRDVPKVDVVLLDRKDSEPVGAGETPIIAVAPAMANAVFDSTGVRVRSLPIRVPAS